MPFPLRLAKLTHPLGSAPASLDCSVAALLTRGPASELLGPSSCLPPFWVGATFVAFSDMVARCVLPGPVFSPECFFSLRLPRVTYVHQAHTWERLPSPHAQPVIHRVPCFFKASMPSGMYQWWTGLSSKSLKSVIRHQILPLPFYCEAHLSICSTLLWPQDF